MKKVHLLVPLAALLCMAQGSSVMAAPRVMEGGGIFDAAYYAEENPDVAALVGDDEASLWAHFTATGAAEGRLPYDPSLDVTGFVKAYMPGDETSKIPTDKNGNGRIDEGYIFIGESHVCMARLGFDLYHVDTDAFSYTSSGCDDIYGDPDNWPDEGNIFFVTSQNIPDSTEWDFTYRNGLLGVGTIIAKRDDIEHWNLILAEGTNYASRYFLSGEEPDAVEDYEEAFVNLCSMFPSVPTSVYVVSAPYMGDPDAGISNVAYLFNSETRKWMSRYGMESHYIDNTKIYEKYIDYMAANTYLTDGNGQALLFTRWDGIHYTARIYYEAFSYVLDQISGGGT